MDDPACVPGRGSRLATLAVAVLTGLAVLRPGVARSGSVVVPGPGPVEPPRPPRPVAVVATSLGVLALAALIAMQEVDRLVRAVVVRGSATSSVQAVVAPVPDPGAWAGWIGAPDRVRVADWIVVHTLVDAVFFLAYGALAVGLLARTAARPARCFLGLLLVAEVAEAVLLLVGAGVVRAGPAPGAEPVWGWSGVLAGVSVTKWVALALLVVAVVRNRELRGVLGCGLRRAGTALWVQRLSAVGVVVLAVLSLVPRGDVSDQLPDVQRAWLGGPGGTGAGVTVVDGGVVDGGVVDGAGAAGSLRHLVVAGVLVVVAAALMFVLGRLRAERAWRTEVGDAPPEHPARYRWWLVGPAVAVVTAFALRLAGRSDLVDPGVLAVFVAGPAALVLASAVLERAELSGGDRGRPLRAGVAAVVLVGAVLAGWPGDGWPAAAGVAVAGTAAAVVVLVRRWRGLGDLPREEPASQRPDEVRRSTAWRTAVARDVWRAGDLLATAALVVGGLSLVRSFTAPVLLDTGTRWAAQVVLLGGGLAVALAAPVLRWAVVRAVDDGPPSARRGRRGRLHRLVRPDHDGTAARTAGAASRVSTAVVVALAVLPVLVLALLVVAPGGASDLLGVVGVVVAALGAWSLLLGLLLVRMQRRRPLPVFRLARLEASPVLSLFAAALLVVSLSGGDPDLHRVRDTGTAPADRPELRAVFDDWLGRSGACDRPATGGGPPVRPMVLVAASGGGIRAAVWTAGALGELAGSACGRVATLLSSGVSGGSLGLVLARELTAGDDGVALATSVADPVTLGRAAAGTLVGDVAAGGTGLRQPAWLDGGRTWLDRAGLIERAWELRRPALAEGFGPDVAGPGGALVLNSTSAGGSCRVLVSQIELGTSPPGGGCAAPPAGVPPASIDLLADYGPCLGRLSWASAAMLSARFPFVTPAGRVTCGERPGGRPDLQLVDGGYAEGSGLGTLADLAPAVADLVREHNAGVGTPAARADAYVVPVVLFLENHPGADVVPDPPRLAPELFVPYVARDAEVLQAESGTLLRRAGNALGDPCPPGPGGAGCTRAVQDLRAAVPGGLAVAAPATEPDVTPPLGWTLSADSVESLTDALDRQADPGCRGVGDLVCLGRVLEVLRGSP